jgi:hypothetical protein
MTKHGFIVDDHELMSEWDFDENEGLNPHVLSRGSNKRAAWKCSKCEHSWKTSICHRALRATGCPSCLHSKRKNYNSRVDLTITHPKIAANWHATKNGEFVPSTFTRRSRFKAYWQCTRCEFEWEQSIQKYNGCANCKKISKLEENNLEKNYPDLIREWNCPKNTGLHPSRVLYTSSVKVWWACTSCDYEWEARISNRSVLGRGCPLCANKVVVEGKNDLVTTHPELAAEWDFEKNKPLKPSKISYGSGKKVWWQCGVGHAYKASILHRAHGTSCPHCHAGRQTSFAEQATFFI